MNPLFFENDFIETFKKSWKSNVSLINDYNLLLIQNPFKIVKLSHFFDESFLDSVKKDLESESFSLKSNDLYHFYQSGDLNSTENLTQFKNLLSSDHFINHLSHLTGIQLSLNNVDFSAHSYPHGGHLLCHDDDINDQTIDGKTESRRIAFIVYLVEKSWSIQDGGQLQLFNTDSNGHPDQITYSILPEWNSFVFFEVTPSSYHQVQEVFSKTDRKSVSGWFHGPKQYYPEYPIIPPVNSLSPLSLTNPSIEEFQFELSDWINSDYLSSTSQSQINKVFQEESVIELRNFLKPDIFIKVYQTIQEAEGMFSQVGPSNARHFHLCEPKSGYLYSFIQFMCSEPVKNLLQSFTNLELDKVHGNQLRMFSSGSYTLLNDHTNEPDGLDLNLSLIKDEWDESFGGQLVYVDEEETLINLSPVPNCLLLVYRNQGTRKFIKYLNHDSKEPRIDLELVFMESNDN